MSSRATARIDSVRGADTARADGRGDRTAQGPLAVRCPERDGRRNREARCGRIRTRPCPPSDGRNAPHKQAATIANACECGMTSRLGLPISVRLYPGETAASYWARLCAANAIGEKDLWLALRREDRTLPIRVTPRSALWKIEALGGLPDGALLREAGGRACGHGGATRQVECPSCRMIPAAVALCRRCAGGDQVTVARMHGPVCVRHRRWHGSGRDIPLPGRHKHLLAQRLLNGTLTLRGVPYRSPEVDAAAELLRLRNLEGGCAAELLDDEIPQFPRRIALTARPRPFEWWSFASLR